MVGEEVKRLVERCALENAVQHNGRALTKCVVGRLIGLKPELKQHIKEILRVVEKTVNEVNKLSIEEQKERLKGFAAPESEKTESRAEERTLKPLPNAVKGVKLRFAPNPDGALTLGNARPAVLCDEYAKLYNGEFILRFDDTDPKIKVPEKRFYKWVVEDLKWLGVKIDKIVYASKRLKIYYEYAERLIRSGFAYVCTCNALEWRKLRDAREACPCRGLSVEKQLERWDRMLKGAYHEGEAVLRIKTDLAHENPSVRDFAAMRIVDEPAHPLVRNKHLWPLYNFASAIDDYLLNITHVLRGQEHALNTVKQKFIYDYLGWKYPEVIILGRFSLVGMVLSKSRIRAGIEKGEFEGWDDVKLGTLRALRRRGYAPEALRKLIIDMGVTSSDATIAEENLAAYNRKIVDAKANRYFFVGNPVKIYVEGLDKREVRVPLHPDDEKRGYRTLHLHGNSRCALLIEKRDYERLKNREVRLKHLCNVVLERRASVTGSEVKKGIPIIHWVPLSEKIRVDLLTPNSVIRGYGEINLMNEAPGSVVQFERVGFARIEKVGKKKLSAVFAHR